MEPEVEVLSNKNQQLCHVNRFKHYEQCSHNLTAISHTVLCHAFADSFIVLGYNLHIVVSLYIILFIAKVWLIISRGKIWKFEVNIKMHEI